MAATGNKQGATSTSSHHTLLVMGNKDVYYLDETTYQALVSTLPGDEEWFVFTDARSGKRIVVRIDQISSVVRSER